MIFFECLLILAILVVLIWKTFTINKKKSENVIKKRRYFTKKNEIGVYYEEDEKGKVKKFNDGQHY
jgi:hypothetical protein